MDVWAGFLLCIVLIMDLPRSDMTKEMPGHPHEHHHPVEDNHYEEGGVHNMEFDHDAILGSRKTHKEFEAMDPAEARVRFEALITEMDTNKDGFVSREELTSWVYASFLNLNKEESHEKMESHDADHDGKVTISEYLHKVYGYSMEEIYEFEQDKNPDMRELAMMMFGDAEKFKKADRDSNGVLDRDEYPAFIHPYDYGFMHDIELNLLLRQYDKNADGAIDFREFMTQPGQTEPGMMEEQMLVDQENFNMYDTDENGLLDLEEIRGWALPDYSDASEDEAEHLISLTDTDNDNKLSRDEILKQQELWVGSSATHYGDKLHDPSEL